MQNFSFKMMETGEKARYNCVMTSYVLNERCRDNVRKENQMEEHNVYFPFFRKKLSWTPAV